MSSYLQDMRRSENEWVRKHALKGTALLIRRSGKAQATNVGSHEFQKNQSRHLARYGLSETPYEVLDRIESAKEGREREVVEYLIERMKAGTLGLIVAGVGSRITRDEVDGARLIMAAHAAGVLFMVKGEILNPRDQHQHARLMEFIIDARRENAERQMLVSLTSHELAVQHQKRIPLPTGFFWVPPDNAAYLDLLAKTDYAQWASPEMLERHKVHPTRAGEAYYVLPDPYPDVFRACSLIASWMIETRDPREVLERIRKDSGYPRPGLLPTNDASNFLAASETEWKPADARGVWLWFRSPALYGTYSYDPKVLRRFGDELPPVIVEDAWPGLLRPEERGEVLDMIRDAGRSYRADGFRGPRNDVLPRVVCSHLRRDGTPCGKRYYPTYQRNTPFRYAGHPRAHVGHTKRLPKQVEEAVLAAIREAFDPASVEQAIATLRRGGTDTGPRRAELRTAIEQITERIKINVRNAEDAEIAKREQDRKEFLARVTELTADRARKTAELAKLDRDDSRYRTLAAEDYERMRALARDIPALLDEARAVEEAEEARWEERGKFEISRTGLVRRIVGRLVREVRVKHLARGAYHIDVVFRDGAVVSRSCFVIAVHCVQPELAWIAYRHGDGTSMEEIVAELNAVPGRLGGPERLHLWTVSRMRMAIVGLAYGELSAVAPKGKYRTVAALAGITGTSEEVILGLGLGGRIGPARVEGGLLCFRPSMADLDRWLPGYARARVARRKGWVLDDVAEVWAASTQTECRKLTVHKHAESGKLPAARDSHGRLYARKSDMQRIANSIENALLNAPEELKSLDPSQWMLYAEARAKLGVSQEILRRCVGNRVLKHGRRMWYHVDEAVEAACGRRPVAEVVQTLGDDSLQLEDFYSLAGLSQVLQTRFGRGSESLIKSHLKGSRVLVVSAWEKIKGSWYEKYYVHVPKPVLTGEWDGLVAWLRGR